MHFFWRLSDIRIAIKKSWCDWLRRDKARQAGGRPLKPRLTAPRHSPMQCPRTFIDIITRGLQMTSSLSWKGQNSWHLYWQRRNTETLSSNLFLTERSNTFSRERFCHKVWKWMQWGGVEQILQRIFQDLPKICLNLNLTGKCRHSLVASMHQLARLFFHLVLVNSMDYIEFWI